MDLREGILLSAEALGVNPVDLATAISYETAGTFDPLKAGPTTQWGQHRGLIQFGEPQARDYGVDWSNPIASQLGPDGAVVKYLRATGVRPGMGLLDIYSAINAGGVGRYNRSDANNGGAPGTVADKVNNQMHGHRMKAQALMGGTYTPKGGAPLPAGLNVPAAQPVPTFRSTAEERQAEGAPSLLEGAGLAIKSEWMGSYALAQLGAEEFTPDEDFRWDDATYQTMTEGLPEAYHDIFDDAVSLAHAQSLRTRAMEMAEVDARLGSMGGTGVALRIGAAISDPIAIGAAILTEGVLAPAIIGQKATRLGRALRAGASAGAVNAGVEGYIASQNPTRGATDVLLAGTTGLVAGGAFGAFLPSRVDRELETVARSLQKELMPPKIEGDTGSIGAARAPKQFDDMTAAEKQLAMAADAPRSAFGSVRIDMVGNLKQSEHPIVRRLAGFLAEDGVGNADGSVLVRAASENVMHAMKVRMSGFYKVAEPAFKDWARENGIPLWKRAGYRETFFEEVGKAVRRPDGMYTNDANINKVAREMKDAQRDLLAFAKEKGVRGFDKVLENDEYMMRVFNHRKLDELTSTFGEPALRRMVANAIKAGTKEVMEDEEAFGIAKAYLNSIRKQKYQDAQLSRIFSEGQADLLENILKEESDLTSSQIANIVSTVRKPQADDSGRPARAQRRLRLDESYRENVPGQGGKVFSLGIEDFLDNNAERLMTLYARQIYGAGFMEEALSHFKVPRGDGEVDEFAPSFETVKQHIRDTAEGMNPAQLDDEIGKLDVLYKAVMGIPLKKNDRVSEALRMLRDFNFIRVMNQVGFAQIAEIGNIIGHAGIRATMQNVPAMRNIWSRAKDGNMSDELLDEIETIWGIGTDRLRHVTSNRMDDYGVYEGAGIGRLDNALQIGKQITADISLMAPVNMALQRMAARATIQRFVNMATGTGSIPADRLAVLGLDDKMTAKIVKQMQKHVYTEEGILGRNVKRLNIEEWTDQQAASAFIQAVDRWSRRVIQENDIGQMSKWMTTDLGKTFIQFRSFMTAAWTKQALSGLHHRDWNTFMMWSVSMLFGGLSYIAQTHINALGRDDADDYREQRLSAAAIGRSAFQRAGFSTIVPGAADTMLGIAGYEPVFAYGRTTGLSSNAFIGNPTLDLFDKGLKTTRGLVASAMREDYQFSQQDWRAASSLVPFQNAMGIRNMLQLMGQNLPAFSE